jgi:hypothetical protein
MRRRILRFLVLALVIPALARLTLEVAAALEDRRGSSSAVRALRLTGNTLRRFGR